MTTETLITAAYAAFNTRKIDAALALMTEDINWPKASEGGRIIGKQEIRAYWTRQWAEFNPHVAPLQITPTNPTTADVKVHQRVKTLTGELLSDQVITHTFTIANGLIARMDISDSPAFK